MFAHTAQISSLNARLAKLQETVAENTVALESTRRLSEAHVQLQQHCATLAASLEAVSTRLLTVQQQQQYQ